MLYTIKFTGSLGQSWTQGLYADKILASINVNLQRGVANGGVDAELVELGDSQFNEGVIVPALQFDGERWV